jgi:hypothetical protein
MKLKDCYIGAKVAITSASHPSKTTLLALSNSEIVGHPVRSSNGLYRIGVRDADGDIWEVPLNRVLLLEEVVKVRQGEAI